MDEKDKGQEGDPSHFHTYFYPSLLFPAFSSPTPHSPHNMRPMNLFLLTVRVERQVPSVMAHILILSSLDAEAKERPSGLNTTDVTPSV